MHRRWDGDVLSETAAAPAAAPVAAAAPAIEPKAVALPTAEAEPTDNYDIDGKTVALTRTQARTYIQKAGAVDKRMQETAESKKKLDSIIADFEKDPEEALRKLGRDPAKIIAGLMERKAKLELMSPEQQAAAKLQEERDELAGKLAKLEEERKTEARVALDKRTQETVENQLIASAEKYGLDKTPAVLEGLCDVADELLEYGTVPTVDQIVQEFIRQEDERIEAHDKKLLPRLKGDRLKAYLKSNIPALLALPPAELLELLGPAGVKAIQTATLSKVPAAAKKPQAPAPVAPSRIAQARNAAGQFLTEADFDRKFRR